MRAWTRNAHIQLFAAILACGLSIHSSDVYGQSRIQRPQDSSSIPASSVALPQVLAAPGQKPTSAAYPDQQIERINWNIESVAKHFGTEKPAQTDSVPADWISAPSGVALPPCEEPVLTKPSINSLNGASKPTAYAPPAPREIVRVNLSFAPGSDRNRSSHVTHSPFKADVCPTVNWDIKKRTADVTEEVYVGDCSSITTEFDTLHTVQPTKIVRQETPAVNVESLEELQQLLPKTESKPEPNYLTELSELLPGEAKWLFVNERLLDLSPGEGSTPAISYLDDLNALLENDERISPNSGHRHTSVANQTHRVAYQQNSPPVSKAPVDRYSSIAPDPACMAGGVGASSLFDSMSNIRLNGLSTSPPPLPRNSETKTVELPRPEDKACQFLEEYGPTYYSTPMRFGAPRPMRNAHVFWHRPLYYEDPNLERCGQTSGCLTTAVSAVHFGTAIAFTPYLTAATHPTACVQSLPDCPTCHSFDCSAYWPGWSWKGAVAQAAAVTGLYFIVP